MNLVPKGVETLTRRVPLALLPTAQTKGGAGTYTGGAGADAAHGGGLGHSETCSHNSAAVDGSAGAMNVMVIEDLLERWARLLGWA